MTKRTAPTNRLEPLIAIMLALLMVAIGLIVLAWLDRFETGHLVLTEAGCQALVAHGIEPEALPESTLCRVHAQFELPRSTNRFGTIRVGVAQAVIEVEVQGGYVVSLTTE